MSAKSEIANRAFLLKPTSIIPNTAIHYCIEICLLVDAMNEAKIRIIGIKQSESSFEFALSNVHVCSPPVFARCVVCTQVNLEQHFFSTSLQSTRIPFKCVGLTRDKVHDVDARINCLEYGSLCFVYARLMHAPHA